MGEEVKKYANVLNVSRQDVSGRATIRARNADTGEVIRYSREEMGALVRAGKAENASGVRRASFPSQIESEMTLTFEGQVSSIGQISYDVYSRGAKPGSYLAAERDDRQFRTLTRGFENYREAESFILQWIDWITSAKKDIKRL